MLTGKRTNVFNRAKFYKKSCCLTFRQTGTPVVQLVFKPAWLVGCSPTGLVVQAAGCHGLRKGAYIRQWTGYKTIMARW